MSCAESRTRRKKSERRQAPGDEEQHGEQRDEQQTFGSWISACRSKLMPLSMKKIGMRNPNPIASSLLVICSVSSPRMKRRTTTPAAKAPEEHVEAQLERQIHEEHDQGHRDADGELGRRVQVAAEHGDEPGRVHLGGQQRGHHGDDDEHHQEEECHARRRGWSAAAPPPAMGPNSPIAPDRQHGRPERRLQHAGVAQDREQGAEAVVVRHSPTTTVSRTSPVACRTAPTPSATTSDASQDEAARPMCPSRILLEVELGAGQEHQVGQAEVRQRR